MVTQRAEDLDCFGLVEDELEAAIQVFYVRRGRVVGRKGFIVDKVEDLNRAQLVTQVLEQHYADAPLGVPPLVLVPEAPEDAGIVQAWLAVVERHPIEAAESEEAAPGGPGPVATAASWPMWSGGPPSGRYRVERSVNPEARSGDRVEIRAPQRGEKKALLEMVTRNAGEEFARHRLKRAADHNARAKALTALQDALDLPDAPAADRVLRHEPPSGHGLRRQHGGDGGRPAQAVRVSPVQDPHRRAERRLRRHGRGPHPAASGLSGGAGASRSRTAGGASPTPRSCCSSTAARASSAWRCGSLEELGLDEEIPVAALAKQFEEVYVPGRADPLRIPRTSEALYLLQQIRDEAHRFAITYHRSLRGKRMTASVLDDIPGLGPGRKKRLVTELGGVNGVKAASLETLRELSWLPDAVADAMFAKLHG